MRKINNCFSLQKPTCHFNLKILYVGISNEYKIRKKTIDWILFRTNVQNVFY
jgi:hypothetical protein